MNYQNLKLECPDVMNCYVVSPFLSSISPGLRQWNTRHEQFSAVTWKGQRHTQKLCVCYPCLLTELYSIEGILSTNLVFRAHSRSESLLSFVLPLSLSRSISFCVPTKPSAARARAVALLMSSND